jgi:hypothetical protein
MIETTEPTMYPHRIRLRGPWECQPTLTQDLEKTLPQDREVTMPGAWKDHGLAGFRGRVLYRRAFGYPGRIDEWERVWLTFEKIDGSADIVLNDQALAKGQTGSGAFDVTSILGQRNLLQVQMISPTDEGGLIGEVALEVRALAYLDQMAVERQADGGLNVAGKVIGTAENELEIYAILDGRHVHYQTVRPTAEGVPLHFTVAAAEAKGEKLRVELVHRSQIWYANELTLPS